MDLPSVILALAVPVSTVLGAMFGSWYSTRTAAKHSELVALRDRVDELFKENILLHKENVRLREYIGELRITLREHGIPVEPMEKEDASTN